MSHLLIKQLESCRDIQEVIDICLDLERRGHALWSILDDIDTMGDAAKGSLDNVGKYALKRSEDRHKYFISYDGYTLETTRTSSKLKSNKILE